MNDFIRRNTGALKLVSFAVGLVSMAIASELRHRETRELVEEVISEREAEMKASTDTPEATS